jgi:hypothetical protein
LIEEQKVDFKTRKKSIKAYEMDEFDARRLDNIYDIDVAEMRTNRNPIRKMRETLNEADSHVTIYMRN